MLSFYMVGMSKFRNDLPEYVIDIIENRLKFLLNMKFNAKFPLNPVYWFLLGLMKAYPILNQNDKMVDLFQ